MLLYIYIIVIIVRKSIYIPNCKCATKVVTVDVDKQTFPYIRIGMYISYFMIVILIYVYNQAIVVGTFPTLVNKLVSREL